MKVSISVRHSHDFCKGNCCAVFYLNQQMGMIREAVSERGGYDETGCD